MTRDEFLAGAGTTTCAPGRKLFVVAIDSEGHQTEQMLRAAVFDYFSSLAAGVRELSSQPSTDQVIAS